MTKGGLQAMQGNYWQVLSLTSTYIFLGGLMSCVRSRPTPSPSDLMYVARFLLYRANHSIWSDSKISSRLNWIWINGYFLYFSAIETLSHLWVTKIFPNLGWQHTSKIPSYLPDPFHSAVSAMKVCMQSDSWDEHTANKKKGNNMVYT